MGLILDVNENVYTTGAFYGTADFDPNAGTVNLTGGVSSYRDVFVSILDGSGNYNGAVSFGSMSGDNQGNSIAVDASGNVIVGGYYNDTCDFDPGVATYTLGASSPNWSDAFVMKIGNVLTGIKDQALSQNNVKLYPNPATSILNIQLSGIDVLKNTTITLMNTMGQEVKNVSINNNQTIIDLESLSAGIYFYKVQSNNTAIQSGKVIIE